jgi:hypothetical protein
MTRFLLGALVVLLAGSSGPIRAADTDAINAEIDKAKKARQQADAKARAALLAAFDDAIKAVAGNGDLDGVKLLQAEKKAFEESGKVPDAPRLRTATAEYQKATKAAQAAMEKVYEQGIKDATKALNIDLAEAIRAELKELTGKSPATKTTPGEAEAPPSKAKWIPGKWEITYTPNRSTNVYIIRPDGTIVNEKGEVRFQIKHRDGTLIIEFPDNKLERLTFAETRLFIEHFNPKSNYERNIPDQVGIGELSKKK